MDIDTLAIGQGLGDLKFMMTPAEVTAVLGEPTSSDQYLFHCIFKFPKFGLSLEFSDDIGNTLSAITITRETVTIDGDPVIGLSKKDVKRAVEKQVGSTSFEVQESRRHEQPFSECVFYKHVDGEFEFLDDACIEAVLYVPYIGDDTNNPAFSTRRLLLRPFHKRDIDPVQTMASDRRIADTTMSIPHPYKDGEAERWLYSDHDRIEKGERYSFAISIRPGGDLIGTVGMTIDSPSESADLGYWLGAEHWNQGYATEAVSRVLEFGFETLGLNRIAARHLSRNPASGRVLQKVGMVHEGTIRQGARKWDTFEDIEIYGSLRSDWPGNRHK